MSNDLLFQVALTLIPNIGPVQAKILLQHYNVEEIFKARKSDLERLEGIGEIRAMSIKRFNEFASAETELRFIEKSGVRPLFLTDPAYPRRLLNCYDSPTLLYYKGEADLNASKVIAIIGTRNHTEYGKQLIEKLIKDLETFQPLIVSGLAFGIDALAHKASVRSQLPTVGVLAHGLDQLYPPEHTSLAKEMIRTGGGLLTEFRTRIKPDKHNFPIRNRVVAGMSDAIIVVETGLKGGSMITAELANGYNRDVFAYPGKVTDQKSIGCNYLVKNNKAILLADSQDLAEVMNWTEKKKVSVKKQRELFIELSPNEKTVIDILKEKDSVHIDEINHKSGLSSSAVASAILNMELQGLIASKPGKLYMLT